VRDGGRFKACRCRSWRIILTQAGGAGIGAATGVSRGSVSCLSSDYALQKAMRAVMPTSGSM
jgi:hypothetical protein